MQSVAAAAARYDALTQPLQQGQCSFTHRHQEHLSSSVTQGGHEAFPALRNLGTEGSPASDEGLSPQVCLPDIGRLLHDSHAQLLSGLQDCSPGNAWQHAVLLSSCLQHWLLLQVACSCINQRLRP